jgi:hypothetical protein
MFMRSTIAALAAFLAAQSFDLPIQDDEGADRRIERGSPRAGGALPARDAHAPPRHYYDRYHNFHRG